MLPKTCLVRRQAECATYERPRSSTPLRTTRLMRHAARSQELLASLSTCDHKPGVNAIRLPCARGGTQTCRTTLCLPRWRACSAWRRALECGTSRAARPRRLAHASEQFATYPFADSPLIHCNSGPVSC